jgi:hypothetical protein
MIRLDHLINETVNRPVASVPFVLKWWQDQRVWQLAEVLRHSYLCYLLRIDFKGEDSKQPKEIEKALNLHLIAFRFCLISPRRRILPIPPFEAWSVVAAAPPMRTGGVNKLVDGPCSLPSHLRVDERFKELMDPSTSTFVGCWVGLLIVSLHFEMHIKHSLIHLRVSHCPLLPRSSSMPLL